MRVELPDWIALAMFAGMMLAVTLSALALAGHFPAEHRRPSLKEGGGPAVLWTAVAVTAVSSLLAVRFALASLPGYAAVIAGGLTVLSAPMVLKALPDSLIDDGGGLLLLAAVSAALVATGAVV